MKTYVPPFKITGHILQLSEAIAYELGRLAGEKLIAPKLSLRKSNQIKTIHASLAIEGNTLTLDQVTDLLEGKRVLGSSKEILEVKNAGELYTNLSHINPFSITDLLNAHAVLMNQLIAEPGRFRLGGVGIFNGTQVTHVPPSAKRVPILMEDLFNYIQNTTEYSWLIKSCVFHYEFEFIHPFADGNGRIGRLWQHLLLMKHHPVFEFWSVEVLIKEHQQEYYTALSQSDLDGESTVFIEFMLKIIHKTLQEYAQSKPKLPSTPEERLDYAKEILKTDIFARHDYMQLHKNISSATASRDLEFAVKHHILQSRGKMNKMLYSFTREEKMIQIYTQLLYEDIEDSYLHNGSYLSVSALSTDDLQNIIQSEVNSLDVAQLIEQCVFLNMWGQALPFQESRIKSMNILRNLKFPVGQWDNTRVLLHRDMLLYLIGTATAGTHKGKIKCAGERTYVGQRKMTELFFLVNSLLNRYAKLDKLYLYLQLIRDNPQSADLEEACQYYWRWLVRYYHVYCILLEKSDTPKELIKKGVSLLEREIGINIKEYFVAVWQIFMWFIGTNCLRNRDEIVESGFKSEDTSTFFITIENFTSNGVFIRLIEKMSIDVAGMQKYLQDAILEDETKKRSFDPFFSRSLKYFHKPIAKLDEGKFCVLDLKFMIEGPCSGLSWLLQPLLEANTSNDSERKKVLGTLRSEYGSLVEPYFLETLKKVFGEIIKPKQGAQGKPDAIVRRNNVTLLFEFTVEYYSIEALYSTRTKKLFQCLDRLFFNPKGNSGKMNNLNTYIENEMKENPVPPLLPILVTERYLGDPALLEKAGYDLEDKIKEMQWSSLKTSPLIISLDELEQFWMFASNDKDEAVMQFADLAKQWLSEKRKSDYIYSFGKFLIKHAHTDTQNKEYSEFFNKSALLDFAEKTLKTN